MRLSKKILLLPTVCLTVCFLIAQQPKRADSENKYRAVHWSLDEGLSQGEVYKMIKDLNGFLWIETPFGLNRFDGSSFKKYFADKNKKSKTIIGNNIQGLIEDSLNNIWIGAYNGLSCYDIKTDTFRNISSAIPGEPIIPFWATSDAVFCWDHSESQLAAYNIHSFAKKTLVKLTPADSVGFAFSDHYPIFDARTNSVWLEKGLPGRPGGGLLQIILANQKKEEFTWSCYRKIPNHSHFSEGMRYDHKRNSIWISSSDGLMEFTLNDKKFHHIDALNQWENLKNFGQWAGIDIDPLGRVWVATYPAGIIIYDPVSNTAQLAFPNDPVLQKNVSEANVSIYCDREGIVWSGSWDRNGIYQMIPFSKSVERYKADIIKPHSLSDNQVYNCVNAERGKVWIGTAGGLNIFDRQTGLFEVLREKDMPGFVGKTIIHAISVDTASQKAWISNHETPTLFEMDMPTKKCRPVILKDSANNRITDLSFLVSYRFKKGCIIWAKYGNQQGIFVVNGESAVAKQVLLFPTEKITRWYTPGDDHSLFLKLEGTRLNLTYSDLNGKWIRTPNPLDSIDWSRIIFSEADQTYWVVAEGQLIHYNADFRMIRRYTQEDGLPDIEIYNVIADDKGNIWFNTDRSISQLNIKKGVITTLTEKDGFEKQDFVGTPTPAIKDADGDLYFPSGRIYGQGFNRVSPDKFRETYPPSKLYIQSLQINQNPFLLSTGINDVQELSLRYFQNKITIETGIIDYYSKGASGIRYKLEGLKNADWQYAPDYYTIRYDGLPPGKYSLLMQASNAGNEFNGPVKSLLINISPAFWNAAWFRIAAVLFLVALLYGFIRWRLHQKFRLRLERSDKEKQLSELRQKTGEMEMQALRAQMNPHFIFNSLNSINRFILQNNRTQASEYLTKFSKLVRLILQNSQASMIPLESELESLELYLDLEALRFDHRFSYKIFVPKDMDISALKVPPLIIQPYAENAIWHGLMHKEEKGQLDIEVSQESDQLFFKITDDGIGRKQSAALASKSATRHKSMGLKITADRIAMLQSSNGNESPVTINDLVNPDGSAAGTEVIIKMPVID